MIILHFKVMYLTSYIMLIINIFEDSKLFNFELFYIQYKVYQSINIFFKMNVYRYFLYVKTNTNIKKRFNKIFL